MDKFKRWLKATIRDWDDDRDIDRADETVEAIHEAGKRAIDLGLPDIARRCQQVTTTMLALPAARVVLCECLTMLPKSESLTPPQVAKMLKVNPDKVLNWIRAGKLHAVNVTAKPGGRPRYRIAMGDVEAFRKGPRTSSPKKPSRRKPYSGKVYY